MPLNEAAARQQLIDPQLSRGGWDLSDRSVVRFEVPVTGYDPTPWNGFTDFSLYDASGRVIAVIEAKRTSRNPREGEEQLRQYIAEISRVQGFVPFGFLSNGLQTYFWDVETESPRLVATFFRPEDLQRLMFLRDNCTPLPGTEIDRTIVDRGYQHEAIRRVAERFTGGHRRALLVMATGTGKTRTAMGLIDVLMRSRWAQRVLFVADRDALVEQALNDGFKAHLPGEPRVRLHTGSVESTSRLYVSTLQTLSRCYEQLSPAFFDLIVFDESHRSIFNRATQVIEYFDARMVGLTATPAGFVDRDTFRVFRCEDQTPTFLYTYEQAVHEKRLVDFKLYQAQTGFQRNGIKGAQLSEEDRDALAEQGLDPDAIDYGGTELEVLVTNRDTLRRQWAEIFDICLKDRGNALPGKTIIFGMTKDHARRIGDVFEEMFPQHAGQISVIYHGVERVHDGPWGDGLISKFRKLDKPRFAVSVDMLDTGIDVPEVVNLVFMRPVQSRIKLWQMIGRGTRNQEACRYYDRLPAGEKSEFLIIDFWQNDFARNTEDRAAAEVPVIVRLFNTRLDLVAATRGDRDSQAHQSALADCRAMLHLIPTESFLVRKVWADIESAWQDSFWFLLSPRKLDFMRLQVGPLLRYAAEVDVAATTFTHKIERLRLQQLRGTVSPSLLESVASDVSLLPPYVFQDRAKRPSVDLALSQGLATATSEQLTQLIADVAPEMRNRRATESALLALDLPDFMADQRFVVVGRDGTAVHVAEYRERVEQRIMQIAEMSPALQAIRDGSTPTRDDLIDLERTLHRGLEEAEIQLSRQTARQAFGYRLNQRNGFLGFAASVLDLNALPDYESVVTQAFDDYIASNNYTGDQIRFMRAVQEVLLTKQVLSEADLYEPPLTSFGRNAVERFFPREQIENLLAFANGLTA